MGLTYYALRRALRMVLTLWLTLTFFFFLLRLNIDIGFVALKFEASPEAVAAFNARWGYDLDPLTQYLHYLGNLLTGDFGLSFRDGRPASAWITERLGKTLELSVTGFALMILIGVPAGIWAALRNGRTADRVAMASAVTGYSLPSFVLGLALMYVFAVWLRLLPSSGSDDFAHLILPALTYGLCGAAGVARFARASLLDVLHQPYVEAATAGGLPGTRVFRRHALPNAGIPLVTMLGFSAGQLVGHAVVIETVFAWPGLGQALIEAVASRDMAVVQALVMLFAAFMIVANFAVDLTIAFIDPRIRMTGHGRHS